MSGKHTAEYHRRWRRENQNYQHNSLVNGARARAKRIGVPFSITKRDVPIPLRCPVLGVHLEHSRGQADNSPSIDRIIPALGYVPSNVIVVSMKANRIKSNATPAELMAVALFYAEKVPPCADSHENA